MNWILNNVINCSYIPGASLDVRKSSTSIMRINLAKGVTVLGRHPDADISLDHASVSRFHAALVRRRSSIISFLQPFPGLSFAPFACALRCTVFLHH